MKITIAELRDFIRNALAPDVADREQLKSLGKRGWDSGVLDQDPDEEFDGVFTIDHDPGGFSPATLDPYVNQDMPAPTAGGRKFGRTGP